MFRRERARKTDPIRGKILPRRMGTKREDAYPAKERGALNVKKEGFIMRNGEGLSSENPFFSLEKKENKSSSDPNGGNLIA